MKCCMEDGKKVQKNHFSYQTAITSTHTHTHNIEQHIVNDINHFGRFIKWVFACNERFTFLPRYASDAIYSHEGINHSKNNIMSSEYQQRALFSVQTSQFLYFFFFLFFIFHGKLLTHFLKFLLLPYINTLYTVLLSVSRR